MRDILNGIIYIKVTTIDKREILEVKNNWIKLEIEKLQEYKEKYDVNYEAEKKLKVLYSDMKKIMDGLPAESKTIIQESTEMESV